MILDKEDDERKYRRKKWRQGIERGGSRGRNQAYQTIDKQNHETRR